MKKRILCIILTALIVVSLIPITVSAGAISTIGDVLALDSNFPVSTDGKAPINAWVSDGDKKMYLSNGWLSIGGTSFNPSINVTLEDGNYVYKNSTYGYSITINMNGDTISSIVIADYTIGSTEINGTFTAPTFTIADVIATNPDFPSSDAWDNIPDQAWVNENGEVAFYTSDDLQMFGYSHALSAAVTFENGNYVYNSNNCFTITFNMSNGVLESITVVSSPGFPNEESEGTYAPPAIRTVTFDSNGGSKVNSQQVYSGKTATKPENPTKSGYTFSNWLDKNGDTFDFNTKINKDTTLTAKWVKPISEVNITFDTAVAGMTAEDAAKTFSLDSKYGTLKYAYITTAEDGAFDDPSTAELEAGERYAIHIYLFAPENMYFDNEVLEGPPDAYHFDDSNLTVTTNDELEMYEKTIGVYDSAYGVNGMKQDIYCQDSTLGTYLFVGAYFTATEYYTVKFDSDGGSAIDSQEVLYGETVTQPTAPTKDGYTFVAWLDADGKAYDFDTPVTEDITLKASWSKKTDPEPINYKIIEGAESTWIIQAGESPLFRSNADFSKFVDVLVDGKVLPKSKYTAKSGSTIVELKPAYTATLAPGKHTIRIVSTDGYAETDFYIEEETIAPTDGGLLSEATMSSAFVGFGIVGLSATIYITRKRKSWGN